MAKHSLQAGWHFVSYCKAVRGREQLSVGHLAVSDFYHVVL